MTHDLMLQSHG